MLHISCGFLSTGLRRIILCVKECVCLGASSTLTTWTSAGRRNSSRPVPLPLERCVCVCVSAQTCVRWRILIIFWVQNAKPITKPNFDKFSALRPDDQAEVPPPDHQETRHQRALQVSLALAASPASFKSGVGALFDDFMLDRCLLQIPLLWDWH